MNRKSSIIFIFIGLLFLASFYVFSLFVKQEKFKDVNFAITVRLQDNIPDRFGELFEDVSIIVSPVASVVWVGIVAVGLSRNVKKKRWVFGALLIPILFGGMVYAEILGKNRVESAAPQFFLIKNPASNAASPLFPKYHVQEEYSYPSGHAARILFLSFFSWLFVSQFVSSVIKKAATALPFLALILFISIGKVYLGHHWITDILGGWIIALAFIAFGLCVLGQTISVKYTIEIRKKEELER